MTDERRREEYLRRVRALHASTTLTGVPINVQPGAETDFYRIYILLIGALSSEDDFGARPEELTFDVDGVVSLLNLRSPFEAEALRTITSNRSSVLRFIEFLIRPPERVPENVAKFIAEHMWSRQTDKLGVSSADVSAVLLARGAPTNRDSFTRLLRPAIADGIRSLVLALIGGGAMIEYESVAMASPDMRTVIFGTYLARLNIGHYLGRAIAEENRDLIRFLLRKAKRSDVTPPTLSMKQTNAMFLLKDNDINTYYATALMRR